jgi:Leu/Phe-tRNA-protein transferase
MPPPLESEPEPAPFPHEEPDPEHPTPELLLWAYRRGIFPMADPITGEMGWYSPDPRGIIPLRHRLRGGHARLRQAALTR